MPVVSPSGTPRVWVVVREIAHFPGVRLGDGVEGSQVTVRSGMGLNLFFLFIGSVTLAKLFNLLNPSFPSGTRK